MSNGFLINTSMDNENPLGTKYGQSAVSIAETLWMRLSRYGRPKSIMSPKTAISNTTTYSNVATLAPNIGMILYPRAITITVDQPAVCVCHIQTQIDNMNNGALTTDPTYRSVRLSANTPYVFYFEGEYFVGDTGYVQMKILPDVACNAWSSIDGFEVTPDA